MVSERLFSFAGQHVRVAFMQQHNADADLLPSFGVFAVEHGVGEHELLFSLVVDDDAVVPAAETTPIRNFDTGNGFTDVRVLPDGGYQFRIDNIEGQHCCLLQTDRSFRNCRCALRGSLLNRRYGLNNAMMLIFAFAGAARGLMLVHASCVEHEGRGYAFIAKSGTGKSTHSGLWMSNIPGTTLLNDDNPVIRIDDSGVWLCGSPWSGKTPCYRNREVPLGAVVRIERAPSNAISREAPVAAFASLLPACSSMKWDGPLFNALCDDVSHVVERVPVFTLQCLPDDAAAVLCHSVVSAV